MFLDDYMLGVNQHTRGLKLPRITVGNYTVNIVMQAESCCSADAPINNWTTGGFLGLATGGTRNVNQKRLGLLGTVVDSITGLYNKGALVGNRGALSLSPVIVGFVVRDGKVRFYKNGELVWEKSAISNALTSFEWINGWLDNQVAGSGQIAEIKLYSRPFTSDVMRVLHEKLDCKWHVYASQGPEYASCEKAEPAPPAPGGVGGDPAPASCTDTMFIRVCGVPVTVSCDDWIAEEVAEAGGDWRTGAGQVVVLSTFANFWNNTHLTGAWDDFSLTGAYCLAYTQGNPLNGYNNVDNISLNGTHRGLMYNADPGLAGQTQVVLAGKLGWWNINTEHFPYAEDVQVWFKDSDKATLAAGNSMAGRHVRIYRGVAQGGAIMGSGTVDTNGRVRWPRCTSSFAYGGAGSPTPADVPISFFRIEIAPPGADPFPFVTDDIDMANCM